MDDNGYKNPIKIKQRERVRMPKERAFRKLNLKIDRFDEFNIPTVELTNEQMAKFDEFRKYLNIIRKCPRCKTYVGMLNIYCNEDYELRGKCTDCMEYITDGTREAKDYSEWFHKLIMDKYGMSFINDGFPHLLKHEVRGKYCSDCKNYHTTMEYVDLRDE